MKDKFLKIAKCKNGASFYKKYPMEESFFAAHPKAKKLIPKAEPGISLNTPGLQMFNPTNSISVDNVWNQPGTPPPVPSPYFQNANAIKLDQNYLAQGTPQQSQLASQLSQAAPMLGKIAGGIEMIGEQKREKQKAQQDAKLTKIQATAATTKDIDANNVRNRDLSKQRRVMMQPINSGELFLTDGVGTNVLAKNGKTLKKAAAGAQIPYSQMASIGNNIFDGINGGPSAGSTIGSGVGELAGTALGGPVGGAIGSFLGNTIGGLVDTTGRQIKEYQKQSKYNQDIINGAAFSNNFQSQNNAVMQNGGDLPAQEYNALWGGELIPISQNPYSPGTGITYNAYGQSHEESDGKGRTGIGLESLEEGEMPTGQAKVEIERGETISGNVVYGNLFADAAGEKYKGRKFKNIIKDVTKTETKQNKIIDKSSFKIENNPVSTTFDKLEMNSNEIMMIGANMKLKEAAKEKEYLALVQEGINNTAAQYGIKAAALAKGKIVKDKKTDVGQAKYGKTLQAQEGELLPLASKKIGPEPILNPIDNSNFQILPSITQALNKEYLPMNSFKEDGIPGDISSDPDRYGIKVWTGNTTKGDKYGKKTASSFTREQWNTILDNLGYKGPKGNKAVQEFLKNDPRTRDIVKSRHQNLYGKDPWIDPEHFGYGWAAPELANIQTPSQKQTPVKFDIPEIKKIESETSSNKQEPVVAKKRNVLLDVLSQVSPYLRQPIRNPLDPNQLMGENFDLTHNQVDPVQANLYNPQRITPFDISLQDQLNETTASFNAARRTAGNNPAAQAAIAGQEAMMKQKILGEQFRMNQTQKANVYNQNINTLNDAELKNIGILDQQYVRQNQAQSNARAITQNALSSGSDKVQKNRLENFTANVMANRYPDYTFTNEGMIRKLPTFQQFEIPTVGDYGQGAKKFDVDDETPEGFEKITSYKPKKKTQSARNGSILKAFKNV